MKQKNVTHLTQQILIASAPQDEEWLQQIEKVFAEVFLRWERWNVAESPFPSKQVDLLLLLVSNDLMTALSVEQQKELRMRHEVGETSMVAILLRPTSWYQRPLEILPVLPPDAFGGAKPLSVWREGNLQFALERVQQGILEILGNLEKVQVERMQDVLQQIQDAIAHHQVDELIAQGLPERLFALCERLQVAVPGAIAPIFVHLAEVLGENDPQFAERCLLQAEALGLFSLMESEMNS